jgi:hypothetical protein
MQIHGHETNDCCDKLPSLEFFFSHFIFGKIAIIYSMTLYLMLDPVTSLAFILVGELESSASSEQGMELCCAQFPIHWKRNSLVGPAAATIARCQGVSRSTADYFCLFLQGEGQYGR